MSPSDKKRVLFLCIGNSCRSQMAEAFARVYGSDVIIPASAGIAPALSVANDTIRAMGEKNIGMRGHFAKSFRDLGSAQFDLIVNMSRTYVAPILGAPRVIDWDVPDPIAVDYNEHCAIRDLIERLVMSLILELRRPAKQKFRGQGSGQL